MYNSNTDGSGPTHQSCSASANIIDSDQLNPDRNILPVIYVYFLLAIGLILDKSGIRSNPSTVCDPLLAEMHQECAANTGTGILCTCRGRPGSLVGNRA